MLLISSCRSILKLTVASLFARYRVIAVFGRHDERNDEAIRQGNQALSREGQVPQPTRPQSYGREETSNKDYKGEVGLDETKKPLITAVPQHVLNCFAQVFNFSARWLEGDSFSFCLIDSFFLTKLSQCHQTSKVYGIPPLKPFDLYIVRDCYKKRVFSLMPVSIYIVFGYDSTQTLKVAFCIMVDKCQVFGGAFIKALNWKIMTLWYVKIPYPMETICRLHFFDTVRHARDYKVKYVVATSGVVIELCMSRGGRKRFQ